jgi:hypothetical protein
LLELNVELNKRGFINPLEVIDLGNLSAISPKSKAEQNDNFFSIGQVLCHGEITKWVEDALISKAEWYQRHGREENRLSDDERILVMLEAYYELAKTSKPSNVKQMNEITPSEHFSTAKKIVLALREEQDPVQRSYKLGYLGLLLLRAAHLPGGLSLIDDKVTVWIQNGSRRNILPLDDIEFFERLFPDKRNERISHMMDRFEVTEEGLKTRKVDLPMFFGPTLSFTEMFATVHENRARVHLLNENYEDAEKDCLLSLSIYDNSSASKDLLKQIGMKIMLKAGFYDPINSIFIYMAGKLPSEETKVLKWLIKYHTSVRSVIDDALGEGTL